MGPVDRDAAAPETRYVESDGVYIAYQVIGDGELDIVAVPGLISHLDLWWGEPTAARFFRRLASLGRLIMFDKRDTGLSDRASSDASLEQRMDDVQAVMRACGSEKAVLFGYSEGGPMSILFAATYPERVTSLILVGSAARWSFAPDFACGWQSNDMLSALDELAASRWGQGESIEWYAPSLADVPRARQAFAHWERLAVTPSALQRMLRMIRAIDVRSVLAAIGVRRSSSSAKVTASRRSVRAATSLITSPGRATSSSPAITCCGSGTPTRCLRRSRSS